MSTSSTATARPRHPLAKTMGALDTAVRSGRALYAGISNYDAPRTREAARISCTKILRPSGNLEFTSDELEAVDRVLAAPA